MKVRFSDGAIRFRLDRQEIDSLMAGGHLMVSAGGITASLATTAAKLSIVTSGNRISIGIPAGDSTADMSHPIVYSDEINGTVISVELDLDTA